MAMSEAFVILEQDSRLRTVSLLQCRPRLWAVLATTDNNVTATTSRNQIHY